jgi:hypothetical protein
VGSFNHDVSRRPPLGSKRLGMGPLSKRLQVNTVVDLLGPRAIHIFPALRQGTLGFGSERTIWSGFEYGMGLARGLV